jgi:hypothetical protein
MIAKLNKSELLDRAADEIKSANLIADRLENIAVEKNSKILLAESVRIRHCADPANHWYGNNLYCPNVRTRFEMIGNYFKCESIFCPICSRRKSYRNYRNSLQSMENVQMDSDSRFYLFTLTVPKNQLSIDSVKSLKILKRAQRKFSINRSIKKMFLGGFKSIEPGTKSGNCLNLHIHYLVISKNINLQTIKSVWTRCLESAYKEDHIQWECKTPDGLAIVNIEEILGSPFVEHKRAIERSLNYIIKKTKIENLTDEQLYELFQIEGNLRSFEKFGIFRDKEKKLSSDYLDDDCVNDAPTTDDKKNKTFEYSRIKNKFKISLPWRTVVRIFGVNTYTKLLETQIRFQREIFRRKIIKKHPDSNFYDINNEIWYKKSEIQPKTLKKPSLIRKLLNYIRF